MDFKKIKAMVYTILGISAENKDPLTLTVEQKEKLDAAVKTDGFAEKFEARHNQTVKAEEDNIEALEAIEEFMAENTSETTENEDSEEEVPDAEDQNNKTVASQVKVLTAKLASETKARKTAEANYSKLKASPEPDNPEIIKGNMTLTVQHSKTHLYGSNNSWDAFEGRSWNSQAAGLEGATATAWNTADISQLNEDIQDYFRKDPKKLHSTFMDGLQLPPHWKLISGVSDEYIFTTISTGEITQGLKIKWLPKNNAKFAPQKGKVRDIQIDIEFKGNELKKLEKSYLNNFFNEGSTPFKDSFILFVVKELMKQARKEDKICFGKGVYFPNENADVPGSFLNNFSGVIKLILEARGKLFKSFKLGTPTEENIFDYVKKFVEGLPHEIKILPDLYFYASPSWVRSYNEARRRVKGRDQDFNGNIMYVDGFSNVRLYSYDLLEGYDFMFLTTEDNIKGLTDKPGEDGVLQFEKDTRNTRAYGDYKLAAFIAMFGRKLIGVDANSYDNQLFFSNDVEALTDVYVPVPANQDIPSLKYHNSLMVGVNNTQATNITDFSDAIPGTKVYVLGNAEANYSTVKDGGKISLIDGDCVLTKNTLLVLYVKADGTFQELERKKTGVQITEEAAVVLPADTTVIDVSVGTRFVTSANTQPTAIVSISNGVTGETYRVEGGSDTQATTIANSGVFVLSTAMTLGSGKFIELYFNGNKFIETARG